MQTHRVVFALLLIFAFGAGLAEAQAACKVYSPSGGELPDTAAGHVLSTITVPDAFKIGSAAITNLKIAGTKLSALKITLSAGTPTTTPVTVVLKDAGAGGDATAMAGTGFSDDAAFVIPDTASLAPFAAAFVPEQPLSTLSSGDAHTAGAGGSEGVWVLRVADLEDASRAVTLSSWTLQLCAPKVQALDGPADDTATATATSPKSNGMIMDFLDRLNTLSQRDPLFSNRTTLREALAGNMGSNDTLLERINHRVSTLLAPFNETLLMRAMNNIQNGFNTTGRVWQATATAAADNTAATPSNGTFSGLASRLSALNSANDEQGIVLRFLESFRQLVQAAGVNTTTFDGHNLRAAMQQSGFNLGQGESSYLSQLLNGHIGSGAILQQFGGGQVLAKLTDAFNSMTNGPILSSFKSQAQSARDTFRSSAEAAKESLMDKFKSSVATASSAYQIQKNYNRANIQDTIKALSGGANVVTTAASDKIGNYVDMVTASNALLLQVLQKHVNATIEAARKMVDDVQEGFGVVNQLPKGVLRDKLTSLLSSHLADAQAFRSAAGGLGSGMYKVADSLTAAYKAQKEAVRSVAATKANAGVDVFKFGADAQLKFLSNCLDQLSSGLLRISGSKTGPILASYKSGLTWLQGKLDTLRSNIDNIPQLKLDGSLLPSLKTLGSFKWQPGQYGLAKWMQQGNTVGDADAVTAVAGVSADTLAQLKASMDKFHDTILRLQINA